MSRGKIEKHSTSENKNGLESQKTRKPNQFVTSSNQNLNFESFMKLKCEAKEKNLRKTFK